MEVDHIGPSGGTDDPATAREKELYSRIEGLRSQMEAQHEEIQKWRSSVSSLGGRFLVMKGALENIANGRPSPRDYARFILSEIERLEPDREAGDASRKA